MLFGLGGGVGFMYWYMKKMPAPFIGTRYGNFDSMVNTCKHLGGNATMFETTSVKRGYEELKDTIRKGEPVAVFLDMAYLPYFALPAEAHFGAHTAVVYGLDEQRDIVYISDCPENPVKISVDDLCKARNSKYPPFAPKNKLLKINYPRKMVNLEKGIRQSIQECCDTMLNPPIKNFGLAGIKKWAGLVLKWPMQFKGMSFFGCLLNTFIYIEVSGTGGSGFRTMYVQFLREAADLVKKPRLHDVADIFEESARAWTQVAEAALPDTWPILGKTRELSYRKNEIFRKQKKGTEKEMQLINEEAVELMKKAVEELATGDPEPLLNNLRLKILKCLEIEERAFNALNSVF
jgi:hypothetical protein